MFPTETLHRVIVGRFVSELIEKIGNIDLESFRDCEEPACADAVTAILVFLDLLI